MISRSSLNMGHLLLRSQELKIENLVNTLVAAVLIEIFLKLVRRFVLMISRSNSNMARSSPVKN
jgi:uncharacterized membrane protein YczE